MQKYYGKRSWKILFGMGFFAVLCVVIPIGLVLGGGLEGGETDSYYRILRDRRSNTIIMGGVLFLVGVGLGAATVYSYAIPILTIDEERMALEYTWPRQETRWVARWPEIGVANRLVMPTVYQLMFAPGGKSIKKWPWVVPMTRFDNSFEIRKAIEEHLPVPIEDYKAPTTR